jgi:hypothetical protein
MFAKSGLSRSARFLRIAVPRLHANAAGIGVLRLIDFILPGVQDT